MRAQLAPIAIIVAASLVGAPRSADAAPRTYEGPQRPPTPPVDGSGVTQPRAGMDELEPANPEPAPPPSFAAGDPDRPDGPSSAADQGDDDDVASDDDALDADYDPRRDSPEGQLAGRRIRGGIIFLAVGTVMGVGSLALAASDPCRPAAGNGCQVSARRRGALTLGIPALAVLAAGAALLGIGVRARRRIGADLAFSREGALLTLGGRF